MPRARQPPPVARACLSLVRHFRNPTLGPPPPHSPSPFVARPPPPTRRHPLFRSSAYPREHPAHQQPRPSRGRLKLTAPRCCAAALACVRASPRLEPRLVIDTLGAARGTYTGYAGPPIRGGRRGGGGGGKGRARCDIAIVGRSMVILIYCEGGIYCEIVAGPDAIDAINLFYCYPEYIIF